MKLKTFLTVEEIASLQEQEAASDKLQKRTPEQIEAIYSSGRNILVSASAGSGKTFVMVERILDQICRGIEMQQLFVSTFTVKAAGELKERLEKKLAQTVNQTSDEELKRHLALQMSQVATSDIGTMDSFAQKLLTKHGYLLGLAPQFRILQDASEQDLLKNEVFSPIFDRYYEGKEADLFRKLVKNFAGNRKNSSGFRQQVYAIYAFLQSTANPERWLKEHFLKGSQSVNPALFEEQVLQQVADAVFDLESFLTAHLNHEAAAFGKAKYLDNIQLVLEAIRQLSLVPGREELLACLDRILTVSKGVTLTNSSRKEELQDLKIAYNEAKNAKLATLRNLQQQLYFFGFQASYQGETLPLLKLLQNFVADFSQEYLERKKAENAFEFADISHFAIQLLEEFPQVRESYRKRYHEVMVDEYQDTNHIQERMLELLSNGHNRFMVGDIKQSIYRFRQADPQIFSQKFNLYQENPTAGKLIVLKENFRSHEAVLNATNSIFKHLMDEEVGEINYNQTHYLVPGSPRQQEDCPANQTEFLIYNTDEKEGEDISHGEILLVIKEIIRLHEQEGVAFRDITLLVPSRTRNDLITRAFEEHGIPLVADGGEVNYLESLEVMVLLDTLRTINNPLQDYALVALLKSPMFDFNEDDLTRIALQKRQSTDPEQPKKMIRSNFYSALQTALKRNGGHPELIDSALYEKIQRFDRTLQNWRRYAKNHSLYDLIWKIYQDRLYYDYVGALPKGAQRQANLYALTLRANDYEKSGFKGLSRFIGMIDKILESQHDLASVASQATDNAVSLMTVHKSKGLEFDYVFLLNMDKTFNNLDTSAPIIISRENGIGIKYLAQVPTPSEEQNFLTNVNVVLDTLPYVANKEELKIASLSEQMRLLYVAMTRAATKLYLVGKGSQQKLSNKFDGQRKDGRLPASTRANMNNFQDWILAIAESFKNQDLHFQLTYVSDQDLTLEKVGHLSIKNQLDLEDMSNNRQSEDITRALNLMDNVTRLNQLYQPAIELPTVRTPSQIKKLYEPVMDSEGLDMMVEKRAHPSFKLPTFGKSDKVTGAQLGSAVHALMQRIDLHQKPTLASLTQNLAAVAVEQAVKEKIDLIKIAAFFDTTLGQTLLTYADQVQREAPFAMLKTDPVSKEQFVIRGILDGYLPLDDRIILFDYKTDRYQNPQELAQRYQEQMRLYAEALTQAYGQTKIEKYLILLGGEEIEVLSLD